MKGYNVCFMKKCGNLSLNHPGYPFFGEHRTIHTNLTRLCRAWKGHVTMKPIKWYNSIKSVGGVKVLVLCTLPDNNALYLYQVLPYL